MYKLLVNTPSGKQEVIEVGEGGGYFEPERVIWDERADGPLPEITLGGMVRQGSELAFSQERMDENLPASAPPVPRVVEMAQAREALIRGGISIASVDAAIDAIEDPVERELAFNSWQYRATVRRDSHLLTSLAAAIGLSNAQVDELFIAAAAL